VRKFSRSLVYAARITFGPGDRAGSVFSGPVDLTSPNFWGTSLPPATTLPVSAGSRSLFAALVGYNDLAGKLDRPQIDSCAFGFTPKCAAMCGNAAIRSSRSVCDSLCFPRRTYLGRWVEVFTWSNPTPSAFASSGRSFRLHLACESWPLPLPPDETPPLPLPLRSPSR